MRWLKGDGGVLRLLLVGGSEIFAKTAGVGLLVLLTVVFFDVICRHAPFQPPWGAGGGDIIQIAMALMTCFGLASCWYASSHIRIEFVRENSPPRLRAFLDAMASFIGIFFIAAIAWSVVQSAISNPPETRALGLSQVPFRLIFAMAMTHFTIVLVASFWGYVRLLFGRTAKDWAVMRGTI